MKVTKRDIEMVKRYAEIKELNYNMSGKGILIYGEHGGLFTIGNMRPLYSSHLYLNKVRCYFLEKGRRQNKRFGLNPTKKC